MPPEGRRLALVGYGKMGRLIEQLAPEYGFAVALKLDEFNNTQFEGCLLYTSPSPRDS